jgi:nitrite reductase/ring-hydroxylating ferredoxin subunit
VGKPGAVLDGAVAAPASGTASASTPAPAAGPASPPSAYPWLQQWYPAGVAADLPADRPHAFTLFGRQLVLWRDGDGTWRCFADACPHRLAPLSEGKVTGGQLLCSYHGWSFEGSGKCTRMPQVRQLWGRLRAAPPSSLRCRMLACAAAVPAAVLQLTARRPAALLCTSQAMDARNEAAACGNRRACAAVFPTAEAAGLVWVWPESAPGAAEAAAAAGPPPAHPDLLVGGVGAVGGGAAAGGEEPRFVNIGGGWLVREVPYGWDTMVENIVDPGERKLPGNWQYMLGGTGIPSRWAARQGPGVAGAKAESGGGGASAVRLPAKRHAQNSPPFWPPRRPHQLCAPRPAGQAGRRFAVRGEAAGEWPEPGARPGCECGWLGWCNARVLGG